MRKIHAIILISTLSACLLGCANPSESTSFSSATQSGTQITEQSGSNNKDTSPEENNNAGTSSAGNAAVENKDGNTAQTWQGAYLEILYHLTDNLVSVYTPDGADYRSSEDSLIQRIYLGLHDFENDGTYELIAGDQFAIAIFTYTDGQAEKIADLYFSGGCSNALHFKDNSIGLTCSGAGGSDFINFGYLDGEYLMGIYCEISGDIGTTINGVKSTYDEVDRIYTLDYSKRSSDELKEWIWLVYESEQWVLKYQSGEKVVLNSSFDFGTIMW